MGFVMEFSTENSAFADGNRLDEIARILRRVADKIEHEGALSGKVFDVNGNAVGHYHIDE